MKYTVKVKQYNWKDPTDEQPAGKKPGISYDRETPRLRLFRLSVRGDSQLFTASSHQSTKAATTKTNLQVRFTGNANTVTLHPN